jgi:hypothetical protein
MAVRHPSDGKSSMILPEGNRRKSMYPLSRVDRATKDSVRPKVVLLGHGKHDGYHHVLKALKVMFIHVPEG